MARKKKETVTTPIAEPVVAPEPAPSVDAAPPFEPMIFTLGTCRACLRWIAAEEDAGPVADQHAAGCALRDDPTPFPRDDAEMADVRERCAKGPIPPPAKSPPERTATTPTPAPVVEPKPEKAPRKPRARKVKVPPVDATAAPATPDAASSSAPEPIATPTTETGAPPVVTSLVETLKKTFPELAEPEVIQGTDVAEAATWVDLSVAFSPVLPARQSLLPVEATQLDGGRYRIYAPHAYSTPGVECWGAWEAEQAKPDFGHNAHGDRYDLGTGRCF